MTPPELLARCRSMLGVADPLTAGLWPRCVAFLLRQALEEHLAIILGGLSPGARATPMRTQLIVFSVLWSHKEMARRVAYTWYALSEATHYQGYELPPPGADLHGWMQTIEGFVASGVTRK